MLYSLIIKRRPLTKYLGFCGLLLFILTQLPGAGCTPRTSLEKPPLKIRELSCDPQADEAMHRHDYETSIRLHHQFIEMEPENELALYHLGYAYGQTGQHQQEVFYYERAIALGLKADHIFFNLGMAHGELNQLGRAIDAFKAGLAVNPTSADNYFGLALTYDKSGRKKAAENAYKKAIEMDPRHLDARFCLSLLYKDMGNVQEARKQLLEILVIDPSDIDAQTLLEAIEKEEGGNKPNSMDSF